MAVFTSADLDKNMQIPERVENIKRPLNLGEIFLVPCLVRETELNTLGDWMDVTTNGRPWKRIVDRIYITPVINHPHNDKENGQQEIHYHPDYRFIKHYNNAPFPDVKNNHSKYYFVESIRPQKGLHGELKYIVLPVVNEEFSGITEVENINKSNLKHKCIHKGKCPHRGYDLSQVTAIDGIIKCPLHGLKFSEKSGQLVI